MSALIQKEQATKWLSDHGIACSGKKEELITRIKTYLKYPKLAQKLKLRTKRYAVFPSSLEQNDIPKPSSSWSADDSMYPKMSKEIFNSYSAQKKEGSMGQQEKAYRMVQSRKIVSVKTFKTNFNCKYVKAVMARSYGTTTRPVTIFFQADIPKKAHCTCPVGASGLCCHALALLLYLLHFTKTNEKLLQLTCTEQLQRWHQKTNKGSLPMVKLSCLKLRSAKRKKSIKAADPDNAYFKRDVNSMIKNMNKKLDKMKPVTEHVFSVLSKSNTGRKSSVGEHLCYKFRVLAINAGSEQNKFSNVVSDKESLIKNKINELLYGRKFLNDVKNLQAETDITKTILEQENIGIEIVNYNSVYPNHESKIHLKNEIYSQMNKTSVEIDISYLEAPSASSTNYVNVKQNSPEWLDQKEI